MTGRELLPFIKAEGRDGKYSENFAKWVKVHKDTDLQAVFCHWSNIDGSHVEMVEGKTQTTNILIGRGLSGDGWCSGTRLASIINGGGKEPMFAFPPRDISGNPIIFTPLPNWFEGYINGGKCFIDPEHRLYGPERWQVNGKTRSCLWCGQWHEIQRKRKVTKTVTSWVKMEGVNESK